MPPPIQPAPPSASRAVVVGLERYRVHTLHGPVAEALLVAQALQAAGVDPQRIDLWLAPADAASQQRADAAGLPWRLFEAQAFTDFLVDELAADEGGGTLYVHWCGHGIARDNQHHLLLPRSSAAQLESFDLDQLARLLVDGRHPYFDHLVLVVDTCRESLSAWGQAALAPQALLAQGRANGPVYCKLFVCAEGRTTTYSQAGSSQGVLLREVLAEAGAGHWPDFKARLQAAAARLEAAAYVYATDWNDQPLVWAREPALSEVFGSAAVPFARQAELAALSLRPEMPRCPFADTAEIATYLGNLPAAQGVAPLHEFALRLLAEAQVGPAAALRAWVQRVVSPAEQASIDERMKAPPPLRVLQLWVAEDPDAPSTQPAWTVMAARCNATGEPLPDGHDHHEARHAVGLPALKVLLAQWLAELQASSKEPVELFLPRALLAEGLELQDLHCADGETSFDLASTYVTLVRNPRELPAARRLWRERAPDLLARWPTAQPLAQAPAVGAPQPAGAYLQPNGPLWCLVPDAHAEATALSQAHRLCTSQGLPALAWARGATAAPALQARLDAGLRGAAREAPDRLLQLRLGGLHDLSLMLDDPARPPPWGVQT